MSERPSAVVSIRLKGELLEEIDALVAEMQAERRGMRVTRSDAVRVLLFQAVALKRRRPRPPRGSR